MDRYAPRKVKLKADLTKYDERLTIGQTGITTKDRDGYASFDHFAFVRFENGAQLAVAFKSLEVMEGK